MYSIHAKHEWQQKMREPQNLVIASLYFLALNGQIRVLHRGNVFGMFAQVRGRSKVVQALKFRSRVTAAFYLGLLTRKPVCTCSAELGLRLTRLAALESKASTVNN